jgi:methyl-accepting chemotaxis protein
VVRLNKRVQQIGKVVEFINEIADKSDLLALNAELEGTKAGSRAVASRWWPRRCAGWRRTCCPPRWAIERLIDEIRDCHPGGGDGDGGWPEDDGPGASLAAQVDQSLGLILELARQTSHAVRSISMATQQQQMGTDQLASAMGDILRVTEQNGDATKQMVTANADLSTLART